MLTPYRHIPQVAPGVAGTVEVHHVMCVDHQIAWMVNEDGSTPEAALAHEKEFHV